MSSQVKQGIGFEVLENRIFSIQVILNSGCGGLPHIAEEHLEVLSHVLWQMEQGSSSEGRIQAWAIHEGLQCSL